MIKHGSSHGLAILVCTILSGLLVKLLQDLFPALHDKARLYFSELVTDWSLPLEPSLVATLIIAVVLGVLWGIAFKFTFKN
jgi:hypothetical protein